jgi:hypothetical protein
MRTTVTFRTTLYFTGMTRQWERAISNAFSFFSSQRWRSNHHFCKTAALIGCAIWLNGYLRLGGRVAQAQVASGPASQPVADERAAAETKRALARYAQSRLPAAGAYRGAALQIQDVSRIEDYKKALDGIAADGFDTVELVVSARQENGSSDQIFLDMRLTPTPDQLSALIQHAQEMKLRVVLMPMVLLQEPRGNEWRGNIKPMAWEDWFDSYRSMAYHYAVIAEQNHVDVLTVGTELVSSESHEQEWEKTIAGIRARFHGKLTYSSNWDHYSAVGFWNKLDFIGMNSFWKLGSDSSVSVAEIESHWHRIQNDLVAFSTKEGKPLIFLEVGWFSQANAANEPWDYTKDQALDVELQRKLYEGFFRSWYGNPNLGGFMIWEWSLGDVPADDKGFSPQNKPANKVLSEWLAKPPWVAK